MAFGDTAFGFLRNTPVSGLANGALNRATQIVFRTETLLLDIQYRMGGTPHPRQMSPEAQELMASNPRACGMFTGVPTTPERSKEIARALEERRIVSG